MKRKYRFVFCDVFKIHTEDFKDGYGLQIVLFNLKEYSTIVTAYCTLIYKDKCTFVDLQKETVKARKWFDFSE